ncbi:MAG: acyltransferase [Ktedonobacterales bacterium]
MKQIGRKSLAPLTGARFLAALWVVLYHSTNDFGFQMSSQQSEPILLALGNLIVRQGYLAVDFFFLLSGFILSYNYITPDGKLRGGKRAFWVARIARIYPVYLLGIVLGAVEYLRDGHALASATITIALHLLLVQSWIPAALAFDLNPPAWSLAAEALFYALFPLLLPLCARFGRRSLPLVAGAAWGMYALTLASFAVLGQGLGFTSSSWLGAIVSFNPLVRLPEFLVGLALGLAFVNSRRVEASSRRSRHLIVSSHDLGIAVALGALGAVFVLVPPITDHIPVANVMAVFAIPLFVLLIYLLAFQTGLFAWIFSLRLVAWLGEISYGIYILHWPLWYLWHTYVTHMTHMLPFKANSVWSLIIYLFLLVVTAGLSFKYLEGPTRRAIRAWWAKPKRVESDPSLVETVKLKRVEHAMPQPAEYDPTLVETVKLQAIPKPADPDPSLVETVKLRAIPNRFR